MIVLAAVLAAAILARGSLASPALAVAGALLLLALGAIGVHGALHAMRTLGPTLGFLAALLVLADGCRREGLFAALGAALARRSEGGERRLLALVFAAAIVVTVLLGLDATVLLLTPVVLASAARAHVSPRAPAYACVHLANSASLLLPVSNLTNLLAFRASGVSFARFGLLMLLPTGWAVLVDWVALARLGAGDAPAPAPPSDAGEGEPPQSAEPPAISRLALTALALTLAGFLASSALGVAPVWIAVAGAALITVPGLARRGVLRAPAAPLRELVRAVQPGFIVFVLGLAVVVAAAGDHGLRHLVRDVLPAGSGLAALLLTTAVAATLANLVNNLPATLLLVPVAAGHGLGPVLAVLIGVNLGPNLTEVGSLATLLWRRVLAGSAASEVRGLDLPRREFAALGALTVPPALAGGTALLWLALKLT